MNEAVKRGQRRIFGRYSLNLVASELRCDDVRVRLQPQPLRLLILLTDRPGELITREEIKRTVWGEGVHLEFEPALNFAIGQVRAALRDSASRPRYIETVPKIGYRFIAPLEEAEDLHASSSDRSEGRLAAPAAGSPAAAAPTTGDLHAQPEPESAESVEVFTSEVGAASRTSLADRLAAFPHRRWMLGVGLAFGMALIGMAMLAGFFRAHRLGRDDQALASIVVLPFVNLTGDPAREYLADGMTEEMIARLAVVTGGRLRVIARTSSMFYKGKVITAKSVGSELGVPYVLESSLRSDGSQIQVTMQLVRTADESHVWTTMFSTDTDRIFASTGVVASEVVAALPLPRESSQTNRMYVPASTHARDQYLIGEHFLWLRTRDGLYRALDCFQSAVAADASYAQAYAQLATTYNLLGQYGWMEQKKAAESGEKAANQALLLDGTLADAHAARGFSRWFYQWDWVRGKEDFQDALRSDPSNANALHWYALALLTEGRVAEAREWMDRALKVDPKSLIIRTNRGWIEYLAGDPKEAARRMELVLQDDPGFLAAHNKLWAVYTFRRQDAEAFRHMRFLLPYSLAPASEDAVLVAYQRHGYQAALHEWLHAWSEIDQGNATDLARLAIFSKDPERAILILQERFREHDGWMVFTLIDPAFEHLRDDPRMKALALELRKQQKPI